MSTPPPSVLLDKGVIRRVYERRVRFARGAPPIPMQVEAAKVYAHFSRIPVRLYMTAQTEHILQRRPDLFANPFLLELRTLAKGRYLRRWARRSRDFGFSPEDAIMLAYGSFGVDVDGGQVGVDTLVTGDLRLAQQFHRHQANIAYRFRQMQAQLSGPYNRLRLPEVVTTTHLLSR